ncbi:MAG: hypothetical protein ACI3ZF_04615 [Candidatus Cryptobacteroides sp.]
MPRTAFFSKETIISKALELVRAEGSDTLSARNLSKALNCSISPLFTVFENMDEIKTEVRKAAAQLFADYVDDVTDYNPAFKEFGLRLVRFAKEEKNLFYLLFLDTEETGRDQVFKKAQECLEGIEEEYGITAQQADFLFTQMWTYTCGLAIMNMKGSEALSEDEISQRLSAQFSSQMFFIKSGRDVINIAPHKRGTQEKKSADI